MRKYALLATISLMFNVFSFSSLVFHIHKTKETTSFNWYYLMGNLIAQILLIIYGLANKAPEIYGPTILLTLGLSYIIFIKYNYSNEEKNKTLKKIKPRKTHKIHPNKTQNKLFLKISSLINNFCNSNILCKI
jgi:hypothetical protein